MAWLGDIGWCAYVAILPGVAVASVFGRVRHPLSLLAVGPAFGLGGMAFVVPAVADLTGHRAALVHGVLVATLVLAVTGAVAWQRRRP